jgi:hypothetical protein
MTSSANVPGSEGISEAFQERRPRANCRSSAFSELDISGLGTQIGLAVDGQACRTGAGRPRSAGAGRVRRSIWARLSSAPARLILRPSPSPSQPSRSASAMRAVRISFRLAGPLRRSPTGPAAHSFHHRGRDEDQRGCHGARAHRYERGARSGPDIRSGTWWRRVETERFRHMMSPENLKIDCAPGEYLYDAADSP